MSIVVPLGLCRLLHPYLRSTTLGHGNDVGRVECPSSWTLHHTIPLWSGQAFTLVSAYFMPFVQRQVRPTKGWRAWRKGELLCEVVGSSQLSWGGVQPARCQWLLPCSPGARRQAPSRGQGPTLPSLFKRCCKSLTYGTYSWLWECVHECCNSLLLFF